MGRAVGGGVHRPKGRLRPGSFPAQDSISRVYSFATLSLDQWSSNRPSTFLRTSPPSSGHFLTLTRARRRCHPSTGTQGVPPGLSLSCAECRGNSRSRPHTDVMGVLRTRPPSEDRHNWESRGPGSLLFVGNQGSSMVRAVHGQPVTLRVPHNPLSLAPKDFRSTGLSVSVLHRRDRRVPRLSTTVVLRTPRLP